MKLFQAQERRPPTPGSPPSELSRRAPRGAGEPRHRNAMRSGAACGLVLFVLCGASTPILAQDDDAESVGRTTEVAPGDYQQALAPYGAWVDDGSYGHVWQPPAGGDWPPFIVGSW